MDVAHEAARPFRTVIRVRGLLDSDRLIPNSTTKPHEIAASLRRYDIQVHVLTLREAENYIPDKALLKAHGDETHRQRVTALSRLTDKQRGYFDMKSGFQREQDGSVRIPPAQKELFATLDDETLNIIAAGFGRKILECLADGTADLAVEDFATLGQAVEAELRLLLKMISEVV
ncbi:hypothetical protein [Frankia sp. CiP3]|uniref:hypothetical protein n=1 Tax=Frankia sp. CiP3 TaxID=2880971 RepID=UPI001EF5B9CF|nr:hypothetical protein [Frankia sp. CiP3]